MKSSVCLSLIACAVAAGGCDDPIDPVEQVHGMRVLGARVEVAGDPGRAAPNPGETAGVRWFVVAPGGSPSAGDAWSACASTGGTADAPPSCGAPPFAMGSAAPSTAAPELAFALPPTWDQAAAPRVLLQGAICANAAPAEGPSGPSCEAANASGPEVSLEFEVAHPGDVNHNPALADQSLAIDNQVWSAAIAPPPPSGCAQELAAVSPGSTHEITVSLTDADRDPLPDTGSGAPPYEDLVVSYFTTQGSLDRALSPIDPTTAVTPVSTQWTAPGSAPAEGTTVRFFFVVRDLRGGSDFTERDVCVR